jgi:ribonuclease HI
MTDRIIAACDGAAKGNPGPAAWAFVIADGEGRPGRWQAGPLGRATNNVAELTALERLLSAVDAAAALEVRMDSQYAMNAVTTWLPSWKRKGWKTAAGKPVANQELVMRIDALLAGRDVKFVYVAAHQVGGDPFNDAADRAASQAAVTQQASEGAHAATEVAGAAPDAPVRRAAPRAARPGGQSPDTPASGAARTGKSPGGTIAAKYPGTCRCGRRYEAGEKIAKNPQGWGHPECRDSDGPGALF